LDKALEHVGDERRTFLKKLVVGTAFAVPVVSSFTMSGVQAVYAQTAASSAGVNSGNATPSTTSAPAPTTTTAPATTTTAPATTTTINPNQVPATTTTINPNQTPAPL
jgi:hypothetical protein